MIYNKKSISLSASARTSTFPTNASGVSSSPNSRNSQPLPVSSAPPICYRTLATSFSAWTPSSSTWRCPAVGRPAIKRTTTFARSTSISDRATVNGLPFRTHTGVAFRRCAKRTTLTICMGPGGQCWRICTRRIFPFIGLFSGRVIWCGWMLAVCIGCRRSVGAITLRGMWDRWRRVSIIWLLIGTNGISCRASRA